MIALNSLADLKRTLALPGAHIRLIRYDGMEMQVAFEPPMRVLEANDTLVVYEVAEGHSRLLRHVAESCYDFQGGDTFGVSMDGRDFAKSKSIATYHVSVVAPEAEPLPEAVTEVRSARINFSPLFLGVVLMVLAITVVSWLAPRDVEHGVTAVLALIGFLICAHFLGRFVVKLLPPKWREFFTLEYELHLK